MLHLFIALTIADLLHLYNTYLSHLLLAVFFVVQHHTRPPTDLQTLETPGWKVDEDEW